MKAVPFNKLTIKHFLFKLSVYGNDRRLNVRGKASYEKFYTICTRFFLIFNIFYNIL